MIVQINDSVFVNSNKIEAIFSENNKTYVQVGIRSYMLEAQYEAEVYAAVNGDA